MMFKALRDETVNTLNALGATDDRNPAQVCGMSKMLRHLPQPTTLTQVSTLNGAPVVRVECCSRRPWCWSRSTVRALVPAKQGELAWHVRQRKTTPWKGRKGRIGGAANGVDCVRYTLHGKKWLICRENLTKMVQGVLELP